MIIDAHQHFWRIDRGDYSWMDDRVAAIRRDRVPRDLDPHVRACGVAGTVVVQAAPTLAETCYLLDLARRTPLIRGVVGWLDLTGDVPAQIAALTDPALRGIRPMLQDIAQTDWILRADVRAGLAHLAATGLRLDALVTPRHLPAITALARDMPDLAIVIDHCAKPVFSGTDPGDDWRAGLAALAAFPQVYCKLSGLANEYGPGWSAETLRPAFDTVLELFGPARLMWGSDWPVLDLAGDYGAWFAAAQDLARGLSVSERAAIFGKTATTFYALDGTIRG